MLAWSLVPGVLAALLLSGVGQQLSLAQAPAQPAQRSVSPGWQMVWSDEFNGPNGSGPDPAKWTFEMGGKGFGNHELETYTDRPSNVEQRDGRLVITARKEDLTGADGVARDYSSGRIRTAGRFSQAYGRFEARMRLPVGKGIWPAFWMLGGNVAEVGWPRCGEIDIVEAIGDGSTIYSTLHGPGYSGGHALSAKFPLPAGDRIETGFHVYAAEWSPDEIKFYFDDHLIARRTPDDLPAGATWVYDHPFFILLNLAVGGDWPGYPDATTTFPQQMEVDYVRVYSRQSSHGAATGAPASRGAELKTSGGPASSN